MRKPIIFVLVAVVVLTMFFSRRAFAINNMLELPGGNNSTTEIPQHRSQQELPQFKSLQSGGVQLRPWNLISSKCAVEYGMDMTELMLQSLSSDEMKTRGIFHHKCYLLPPDSYIWTLVDTSGQRAKVFGMGEMGSEWEKALARGRGQELGIKPYYLVSETCGANKTTTEFKLQLSPEEPPIEGISHHECYSIPLKHYVWVVQSHFSSSTVEVLGMGDMGSAWPEGAAQLLQEDSP